MKPEVTAQAGDMWIGHEGFWVFNGSSIVCVDPSAGLQPLSHDATITFELPPEAARLIRSHMEITQSRADFEACKKLLGE